MTRPSIISLLFRSCPSAVSWLIVAVVIDALYRMLRTRFATHIYKKMFKRIQPSLAHSYPATAVCFVIFSILFVAAHLDHLPAFVLPTLFSYSASIGLTVNASTSETCTATAFVETRSQIPVTCNYHVPAIAEAQPVKYEAFRSSDGPSHRHLLIAFTRQVAEWDHA